MWKYFSEHVKTFWAIFAGSCPVWGVTILFTTPNLSDIIWVTLKLGYAGLLGFITALGGMFAKYMVAKFKQKKHLKHEQRKKRAA